MNPMSRRNRTKNRLCLMNLRSPMNQTSRILTTQLNHPSWTIPILKNLMNCLNQLSPMNRSNRSNRMNRKNSTSWLCWMCLMSSTKWMIWMSFAAALHTRRWRQQYRERGII